MSPGRASSALTTCRSLVPAFAAWTHVATPPQPPPSILWPFWASDQVTKLAHHGLPGGTPAAARYLSTSTPVFVPASRTPSCEWAVCSADAPSGLPPLAAAALASTTAPGAL